MGQILSADNIPGIVITSSTTASMASTYLGKPTRITIGGQQFTYSNTTVLNFATVGLNGLDSGSVAADTVYYIYAVKSAGVAGLVASTRAESLGPVGYSSWKYISNIRTGYGSTSLLSVLSGSVLGYTTLKTKITGGSLALDPGDAGILYITSGQVQSILAPNPAIARELWIMPQNPSDQIILFSEATAETTAANRIYVYNISPHVGVRSAFLVYSPAGSRWICVARTS